MEICKKEPIEYAQCEICGKREHPLCSQHETPDYPEVLYVGCDCAENMSEDYETPRLAENSLKNKSVRWRTFEKET